MDGSYDHRAISAAGDDSPIGIVSGAGTLPFAVAKAAAQRHRPAVLFALRGCADASKVAAYPHHWIGLGQIDRLCRLARQEGCRDLVFIGGLVRPAVRQLRPDLGSLLLLPRIIRMFRGGDAHLLSGVADIFIERGFRVVGAHEIAPEILMPEGTLGRFQPSAAERVDVARGLALLHAVGPFDVGQAVIVADRHILALEAADGTDEMLVHVAELRARGRIRNTGGVLVKAPKPNQDRRIDLPAIGPGTIEGVARAGLAGLAVVAGAAVVAEAERVVLTADREKLFVLGVPEDQIG
jgi:UDP-2,3-diacylglucosamine hydrolase